MKMTLKNVGLVLTAVTLSASVNAQKSNVTSAAVEYQKVEGLMASQDWDGAIATLNTAKGFIDQAAEHPETKEWDKMFWYKGNIYTGLAMLPWLKSTMTKGELSPMTEEGKAQMQIAVNSYTVGYSTGKKYKQDIESEVRESAGQLGFFAGMMYEGEKYDVAGDVYSYGAQFFNSISILDSAMLFNAGLCYETAQMYKEAAMQYEKLADVNYRGAKGAIRAAYCYKMAGDFEKAKEVIAKARKTYPSDKDLLTELVNIRIDEGDNDGAKNALDDAISADPNNPALHYIIGTIYMNLENNEEAEKSLRKALEIKPDYVNAQYQLGAHLYNWASALKEEASFLKVNDPREAELLELANKKMESSIAMLEKYIESEPNDKDVLGILYKAYHKQENTEKAMEYKKRYDAL